MPRCNGGIAWRKFDPWLVLLALGLVVFGLVVLRSATLLSGTAVNRQLLTQGVYAAVRRRADAGASPSSTTG